MYIFKKSFIIENVFDAKHCSANHLSAKQDRCEPSQRETCLGTQCILDIQGKKISVPSDSDPQYKHRLTSV